MIAAYVGRFAYRPVASRRCYFNQQGIEWRKSSWSRACSPEAESRRGLDADYDDAFFLERVAILPVLPALVERELASLHQFDIGFIKHAAEKGKFYDPV